MLSASVYDGDVKFLKVITNTSDLWLIDLIKHETGNSPFLKLNYCKKAFRVAFKYNADCSSE